MKNFSMVSKTLITSTLALFLGLASPAVADCGANHKTNIVDTAVNAGTFETLVAAVQAAGLVDALKTDGPFTVFAPSDEAFAKLPAGTVESLLKPENKSKLAAILTYHVIPGAIYAADVKPGRVATLQGSKVEIATKKGAVMIDQAKVVATDIEATNGVIHVIDTVIMPEEMRAATKSYESTMVARSLR